MRVIVVDDQELMRRGLRMLLSTTDVTVVGEAAHGEEALALVNTARPDVVLSDAQMPRMNGVQLVTAMHEQFPDVPVIILTTFDEDSLVRSALDAGAAGFLLKDTSPEDLVAAMNAVSTGGVVIDPRVARAALRPSPAASEEPESAPLAVLTRTELAVARLVATGATNGEIAASLVVAEGTVKNHVSSLLRKLGQRDRTALALYLHDLLR